MERKSLRVHVSATTQIKKLIVYNEKNFIDIIFNFIVPTMIIWIYYDLSNGKYNNITAIYRI